MEYILVEYPEASLIHEQEWIDACYEIDKVGIFVPVNLFEYLYCQEPKEEDIA